MKLRALLSLIGVVTLSFVLMPSSAFAQSTNPPPCCNDGGGDALLSTTVPNTISMTDSTLAIMGITRSEFVNRIAGALFAGKSVTVKYSVSTAIDASTALVQNYSVPISSMQAQDYSIVNDFAVTDGVVSISISFKSSELMAAVQ